MCNKANATEREATSEIVFDGFEDRAKDHIGCARKLQCVQPSEQLARVQTVSGPCIFCTIAGDALRLLLGMLE